jgi:hypothetical protein
MYSPLAGVSRDMRKTTENSKRAMRLRMKQRRADYSGNDIAEIKTALKQLSVSKKRTKKAKKYTPFADVGGHLGGALGGILGYPSLGRSLGSTAAGYVGKIFGSGAYKMRQNSLFGPQVPAMHSTDESVVFRHREYLGDVNATAAFSARYFPINPGMFNTFPYLAGIASNFQQYRFKGLVFEFKSTSAVALSSATNTSMGSVMLAVQYDPNSTAFLNKEQLLNEMWATDGRPCDNLVLPVECSPKLTGQNLYYTRSTAATDLRDTDLGTLCIATYGSQVTNNVGELWASYEVELLKPSAVDISGINIPSAYYKRSDQTSAAPLGVTYVSSLDNIGLAIGNNDIIFPVGVTGIFEITWWAAATDTVVTSYPVITYTNCANAPIGTGSQNAPASGQTASAIMMHFAVKISDNTLVATVHFGGAGTVPATGGSAATRVFVCQVSSLMV